MFNDGGLGPNDLTRSELAACEREMSRAHDALRAECERTLFLCLALARLRAARALATIDGLLATYEPARGLR